MESKIADGDRNRGKKKEDNEIFYCLPMLAHGSDYTGWPPKSKPLSRIIIKSY